MRVACIQGRSNVAFYDELAASVQKSIHAQFHLLIELLRLVYGDQLFERMILCCRRRAGSRSQPVVGVPSVIVTFENDGAPSMESPEYRMRSGANPDMVNLGSGQVHIRRSSGRIAAKVTFLTLHMFSERQSHVPCKKTDPNASCVCYEHGDSSS